MIKTKQQYRQWAKETRKKLDIKAISSIIYSKIQNLKEYKNANKIAGFYPSVHEIDTRRLFDDRSKQWFLPVVKEKGDMFFCRYESCSELTLNRYGICEPCSGEELNPKELDIIIVPALAVDKKGYRLGYGKGYYDRFLAQLHSKCFKLVPIPEELVVEELPNDKYDVPVDMTVTESGVYIYK